MIYHQIVSSFMIVVCSDLCFDGSDKEPKKSYSDPTFDPIRKPPYEFIKMYFVSRYSVNPR
jgi:hypothetical protein